MNLNTYLKNAGVDVNSKKAETKILKDMQEKFGFSDTDILKLIIENMSQDDLKQVLTDIAEKAE